MFTITKTETNNNIITTDYSDTIDCEAAETLSVHAVLDVNTPAAKTFDSAQYEAQTLTFDTKANTGHQDFVVVENVAGTKFAIALTKPVAEVQTLTFPDKATASNGDYVVVEDTVGIKYAVALTKPVAEIQTLTFPAKVGVTDGDFIIVQDTAGIKYAVAADTTGGGAAIPAGVLYTAADYKVVVDISGATDAASVAALFEIGLNSLTGFTAAITTSDIAADGTMTLTQVLKAPVVDPVPKNVDESGDGSLQGVQSTAGVAAQTPTGPIWTAATYKGLADISGDTTAADVASRVDTAINLLTGFTAAITSNPVGDGTMTLTQALKAPVTNPVVKTYNDGGAGSISGVQSTAGVASDAPSGLIWTAATYKGLADISSDTTAANVAARVETAFNLLPGFTASITSDDGAGNGTMILTQSVTGNATNPVVKNASEAGAGSITGTESTVSVTTELNLTSNTFSIPTHGFTTGLKGQLTTTGSLPTGVIGGTDYFVIVVDANTISLAASLADALLGTAIDITTEGVGVHTFTPTSIAGGSIKLQKSNDGINWVDEGSATNVTADASVFLEKDRPGFRFARVYLTLTAGSISAVYNVAVKQ